MLKTEDLNKKKSAEDSDNEPQDVFLPLGAHARSTLQMLGNGGACTVRVSPFCHEDVQHQLRGWSVDVASDAPARVLPISFNMFDGVTVVECEMAESELFDVLRNMDEAKRKMGEAVQALMAECVQEQRATWARCRPSMFPASLEKASKDKDGTLHFVQDDDSTGGTPVIDSESWLPELSPDGFIGLYHHWHRKGRESRLCMYVVCQSYLPKACLEFADLAHQVGDACSAGCVCLSEEAQWLRTACSRNRARLIWKVCDAMGLRVPVMLDYHAHDRETRMAIPFAETLHHDLQRVGFDRVRVLNYCAESGDTVCVMAPWEGVWIFNHDKNEHHSRKGLLPTASPRVTDRGMYAQQQPQLTFSVADPLQCKPLQLWGPPAAEAVAVPAMMDSRKKGALCAVKTDGLDPDVVHAFHQIMHELACPQPFLIPNLITPAMQHYLAFDECVLDGMARRGWKRTQGVMTLTPVACALYEHWKRKNAAAC